MGGAGGGVPRVGSAAARPADPTAGPLAGRGTTLPCQQRPDLWPHTWSSPDLLPAALASGGGRRFWGLGPHPGGVGGVRRRGPGALGSGCRARRSCLPPPGLPLLASALQAAPVLPARAVSAPAVCPEPAHLGMDLERGRWRSQSQGLRLCPLWREKVGWLVWERWG